jgi:hypothetical protein
MVAAAALAGTTDRMVVDLGWPGAWNDRVE